MKYLTKSDFLISRDCDRKMYYKKNNYINNSFENEFMKLLAEGGLLVEYVAKMLFKDGKEIDYKTIENNVVMSSKFIDDNIDVTLFNPVFRYEKTLTKIDILVKKGNKLIIYDVHSSSFDGEKEAFLNKNGTVKADKIALLEDIAFQVYILNKKYPTMDIVPILMVLDKNKKSKYSNLLNNFKFEHIEKDEEGLSKPIIEFTGLDDKIVVDNDLFIKVKVSIPVDIVMKNVKYRIDRLSGYINEDTIENPKVPLTKNCKTCEFSKGKEECWKHMPENEDDILDLYYNTTQKVDGENLLNSLINEKKTSLYDWPINELKSGKITERQRIQIENTRDKKEWIDKKMLNQINDFQYPLHFIDFETTRPAIPHNKHDRPYEQLAFQWSCHTLTAPGADLIHNEWISFEVGFPNFKFAESLMNHIKNKGSVFMWHHHERTVLKDIINQIEDREYDNEKLLTWLKDLTSGKRMVDMNVMAKDFYFHPEMKGQTSIKKVLPAIWNSSEFLNEDYNITNFFTKEELKLKDPYKILEDNPDLKCKQFDKINIGTDAIVAHQQMMRDLYMGEHTNALDIKNMLIEYCKLDTFAMYIIYTHWINTLLEDKPTIVKSIINKIKNGGYHTVEDKTYLIREKDLFNGFKIGNFKSHKNSEIRMIHLDKNNEFSLDIYMDSSSNTRISKSFSINEIPTDLLKKLEDIILNSEKFDSINGEFSEMWLERKKLQDIALKEKTLSSEQKDNLRMLNDNIQEIINGKK